MSKGIGNGYINRMKRWHVPNVRNARDRVSIVCDRAFYHEGSFKYKLPRYYRDRLYRMKFPCDVRVWNKKLKVYENKIVYRYQSKNLLSLQMQIEIRNRIVADYQRRCEELRFSNPGISDSEVHLQLCRTDTASRMARQKDIFSKMSRFYNSQRFKTVNF